VSRTGISDYQVRCQCFAPGDHHSISIVLFASILERDPDDLRQRVGTAQSFVYISWRFSRGAAAQFETRLVLTDDASSCVRFTHGLEQELRLDGYMRSIASPQGIQQQMARGGEQTAQHTAQHSNDHSSSSAPGQDRRETTKASFSTPRTLLGRRIQCHMLAEGHHGNRPETAASDSYRQCYASPPTSLVLSGEPGPSDIVGLDEDPHQPGDYQYCFGKDYQVDRGCYRSRDGLPSLDSGCYQPRSESCHTEDGSFRTEDESPQPTDGSNQPGEESLDTLVDRQLLDEIQYRERSNVELQFHKPSRET
jgi:hypothetical protein